MKMNENIMRTLEKVAKNADEHWAKVSSAIVYKGRIVSIGTNKKKSHPFQARFGETEHSIFLHAEISAIKNALREISIDDMKKADLYVCRVKKEKQYSKQFVCGIAKPCCGCERAIVEFGIKNVYYTNNEGQISRL